MPFSFNEVGNVRDETQLWQLDETFAERQKMARRAIVLARRVLRQQQNRDGSWHAETYLPTLFLVETLLILAMLREERSTFAQRCVKTLAARLDNFLHNFFAWDSINEISLLYAAIKIYRSDLNFSAESLRALQELIFNAGGIEKVDGAARIYLAALGQISYRSTSYFTNSTKNNFEKAAKNSPLREIEKSCFVRELPATQGIRELFTTNEQIASHTSSPAFSALKSLGKSLRDWWQRARAKRNFSKNVSRDAHSRALDEILAAYVQNSLLRASVPPCEPPQKIRERLQNTPPQILAQLESLFTSGDELFLWSETHDFHHTALAAQALTESGIAGDDESLVRAAEWSRKFFENFENSKEKNFDTEAANNLLIITSSRFSPRQLSRQETKKVSSLPPKLELVSGAKAASLTAAKKTIAEIDNAANNAQIGAEQLLAALPKRNKFARRADKHSTTILSTSQILQTLGKLATHDKRLPQIAAAIYFLRQAQQANGSWRDETLRMADARDAAIICTAQVVLALCAVGVNPRAHCVAFGANWLLAQEEMNGAFATARGEAVLQTSLAIHALLVSKSHACDSLARGVDFLLQAQNANGIWREATTNQEAKPVWGSKDFAAHCAALRTIAHFLQHAPRAATPPATPRESETLPMQAIRLYLEKEEAAKNESRAHERATSTEISSPPMLRIFR